MIQPDTSSEAAARQVEARSRRVARGAAADRATMSDEVRSLAESGIRSRHPELSDDEVRSALEALLLGKELVDALRSDRPATER